MRRTSWLDRLLATAMAVALATVVAAQPPEGGPPEPGPGVPPPDPLRATLDADGDRELSAEEIKNATAALAKLDRDGDGRIDHEEFRPPRPSGPPGGFPQGFPPRGDRAEGRQPRADRRPFGDGERPEGGVGRASPERFVGRALEFDADGDGKLDRAELEKFAAGMQRMRGGRGGPPADGAGRPERPRPPQ
jgi:hypothetical protein